LKAVAHRDGFDTLHTNNEANMKLSALALVLLCTTGIAMAQNSVDPTTHGPNSQRHLEKLAILLDLTEAQKAQVKAVLDAEHAKMKAQFEAARASGIKPSFEEMHAARAQLKADEIQQLSSVLNATQLKKFQVLQDDERPRWGGPHFRGPQPGDTGATAN
jgi:Spy/CpxP family protein refolding chaperone